MKAITIIPLKIGIDNIFVQDNHSKSLKGVLRGLHFQKEDYSQAKLISVLKGGILDIVVDLRKIVKLLENILQWK